jgi:hypothetical protein
MATKKRTKAELIEAVLEFEVTTIINIVNVFPEHLRGYIKNLMRINTMSKGDLERHIMLRDSPGWKRYSCPLPGQALTEEDKARMVQALDDLASENDRKAETELMLAAAQASSPEESKPGEHVVVKAGGEIGDNLLWVCEACWPPTNEVLTLGNAMNLTSHCALCGESKSNKDLNAIWQSWIVRVLRRYWEEKKL